MYTEKLLNKLYQSLNEIVFSNTLPETVFIITQADNSKNWYYRKENDNIYCIIIHYSLLFEDKSTIIVNMLHQMIHIYNMYQDRNDVCNNGRYHTKVFVEAANQFGMKTEFITRKGGRIIGLTKDLNKKINNNLFFDEFAISKALQKDEELVTKVRRYGKQPITWMCPICKRTAYASPKTKLFCGFCNEELIYKKSQAK